MAVGDTLGGADNTFRRNHVGQAAFERLGEVMTKEIEIHGRYVKLYSLDEGRTWSSSPEAIVAYGQRKAMLRVDLKKSFERINVMPEPAEALLHPVRR